MPNEQAELPWPGALPEPSPSLLHTEALKVDLLGTCGHHLAVSGEGVLECSAGCTDWHLSILRGPYGDTAIGTFAGPWIIEQRWWDRPVRRAYLQVVGAGIGSLIYIENDQWKEEGRYA